MAVLFGMHIDIYLYLEGVGLAGTFKDCHEDHRVQPMCTHSHNTPRDCLAHSCSHSTELVKCTQDEELFQLCRGCSTKGVPQYVGPAILDNDPLVTQCLWL